MKLYKVNLLQVSHHQGYLENGKRFSSKIEAYKVEDGELVPYKEETLNICFPIVVEDFSPSSVKEVKTGIIIPKATLVQDYSELPNQSNPDMNLCIYHSERIHTFVADYDLCEVTSYDELKAYDEKHPEPFFLRIELLDILKRGRANMEAKLFREEELAKLSKGRKNEEQLKTKIEIMEAREEKRKIRQLKRQFRQNRPKKPGRDIDH